MACALLGCTHDELTGRGAGLSDARFIRKRDAITRALEVNHPDAGDPIDGVISAVAALVAARICPAAVECTLPSYI